MKRSAVLVRQSLAQSWCLGLVLVLALALGGTASQPGRVAIKTLLILPEVFADAPARPLLWVSSAPRREEHQYTSAAGQVDADLYLPASGGQHGAVIMYTGAFGLRRDPAFQQVAEALARAGAVVMVPESAALSLGEIRTEEVDTLLLAVAYLRGRSEVDPKRIGVAGFSVGGSLALLAAQADAGRDDIAFVNVFGAYYDVTALLRAIASREFELDGQAIAWEPVEVAVHLFTKEVIGALPDERDRNVLTRAFVDRSPVEEAELTRLTTAGRLVRDLLERPSAETIGRYLDALPPSGHQRLAAMSPSTNVGRLKTRLYVMHGRDDHHIPVTHGRRLAAEAPAGTLRLYTELVLFQHVRPDQELPSAAFLLEMGKLFRHLWLVGQEIL